MRGRRSTSLICGRISTFLGSLPHYTGTLVVFTHLAAMRPAPAFFDSSPCGGISPGLHVQGLNETIEPAPKTSVEANSLPRPNSIAAGSGSTRTGVTTPFCSNDT